MINEIRKNSRSLSKDEMKLLKGGATAAGDALCYNGLACSYEETNTGMVTGRCEPNSNGACVCNAGTSSVVWRDCYVAPVVVVVVVVGGGPA